jgi:Zn-dependent protease
VLGLGWQTLLAALPGVLVAMTFHEYAHGWVAWRLGDPTAARAGRLSPEPWRHIDWLGFLALLLVGFGWAKPVPIDPRYFRRPRRDLALVGLAGPVSNFVMAFLAACILAVWQRMAPGVGGRFAQDVFQVVEDLFVLNVAFGVFNLIPIPPLDGSRVLGALLPARLAIPFYRLERFGLLILIALLLVPGFLTSVLDPVRQAVAVGLYRLALRLAGVP